MDHRTVKTVRLSKDVGERLRRLADLQGVTLLAGHLITGRRDPVEQAQVDRRILLAVHRAFHPGRSFNTPAVTALDHHGGFTFDAFHFDISRQGFAFTTR